MIITIYESYNKSHSLVLSSKDDAFQERWGNRITVDKSANIYKVFSDIADWCNNEIGDECLFEVD